MDSVTISQRVGFSRSQLGWMLALLLAGEVIGLTASFATRTSHPDLSKAFAAGAVTLFFGALLGGIVTQLLGELDRRRLRRASEIEYITNVLADLKAAYDQIDRGRTLIAAHQSAKTYGDEMQNVIEARVKLLQVMRALKFDLRRAPIVSVLTHVDQMERYLGALVDEFEQHYKDVSREQSVYEARMKSTLAGATPKAQDLPPNTPWLRLVSLPRINDFVRRSAHDGSSARREQSDYEQHFLNGLDQASAALRQALAEELGEPRAPRGSADRALVDDGTGPRLSPA